MIAHLVKNYLKDKMKTEKITYPLDLPQEVQNADNYLWIYGVNELNDHIRDLECKFDFDIRRYKKQDRSIREKTVKGKIYLYSWKDNQWKYFGRKKKGRDIHATLSNKIKVLEKKKKAIRKKEEKIILKRVGYHLITKSRHGAGRDIIKLSRLGNHLK